MTTRRYQLNKITEEQKSILIKYIKEYPKNTYKQAMKDLHNKVSCSHTHYNSTRRSILEETPRNYRRSTLYMTLWSYPSEKVTKDTLTVIKDLLETLNVNRRSHFNLIEMKEPAVIEVRETHTRA